MKNATTKTLLQTLAFTMVGVLALLHTTPALAGNDVHGIAFQGKESTTVKCFRMPKAMGETSLEVAKSVVKKYQGAKSSENIITLQSGTKVYLFNSKQECAFRKLLIGAALK